MGIKGNSLAVALAGFLGSSGYAQVVHAPAPLMPIIGIPALAPAAPAPRSPIAAPLRRGFPAVRALAARAGGIAASRRSGESPAAARKLLDSLFDRSRPSCEIHGGSRGLEAPAEAENRSRFKSLLLGLAEASRERPIELEESVLGGEKKRLAFRIDVEDENNYRDAFFIRFSNPEHTFSTLVAYEGFNGRVMGGLEVSRAGDAVVYRHTFDGFFADVLTLRVKNGKVVRLSYDKINPQGIPFYSLSGGLGLGG